MSHPAFELEVIISHPAFELSFSNLFNWAIFLTLIYNMFDLSRTYHKRGKDLKSKDQQIKDLKEANLVLAKVVDELKNPKGE